MNVVKEINAINALELESGSKASWHDEYKDSAYIFIGGLNTGLTEGDVITIFSQFGEVMDVNLPREKTTGKLRGFGFLMYEDQRSTILAVDNLNGATVIDRVLRVDHVKNYKQAKEKGDDGEMKEREDQSLNARPQVVDDDADSDGSTVSSAPSIDPEDPMRDYLIAKRKEEKATSSKKKVKGKSKDKSSKRKREDETPEERRARKERKRAKKEKGDRGDRMEVDRRRSPGGRGPRSPERRSPPARARNADGDDGYRQRGYDDHRR